ncbi:MAG: 30S ribosomal protein S6e [Halobacteriales archaeon]
MANYIVVVADPEAGETHQFEVDDADFGGLTIGAELDGEEVGLPGYTLEFTGGSDAAGRPMRADVEGPQLKELLSAGGTGFRPTRDGERRRITVRGNEVGSETTQLNLVVRSYGEEPIDELLEA